MDKYKWWSVYLLTSCLPILHGTTSTWTGSTSSDLSTESNWSPTSPSQPPTIDDLVIFDASALNFSPTLQNATLSLYEMQCLGNTPYAFRLSAGSTLSFGISGDLSSHANGISSSLENTDLAFFLQDSSVITFSGTSSIRNDTNSPIYLWAGSFETNGTIDFTDQTKAGSAFITCESNGATEGTSYILFRDHSSAEQAILRIQSLSEEYAQARFYDQATAGHSTIHVGSTSDGTAASGVLYFLTESSAEASTIIVGDIQGRSNVRFFDTTTAADATIRIHGESSTHPTYGEVRFHNDSSAARATIYVGDVTGASISS